MIRMEVLELVKSNEDLANNQQSAGGNRGLGKNLLFRGVIYKHVNRRSS